MTAVAFLHSERSYLAVVDLLIDRLSTERHLSVPEAECSCWEDIGAGGI